MLTTHKTTTRRWHLIDIKGQTLGRAATQVASLLIGKHKPDFSAHLDSGDYVVVINSDDLVVTGKKLTDKMYYRFSGYPGGLREQSLGDKMAQDSTQVVRLAVKGMLPKNKLQDKRLARLKIFKDALHPYENQLKTA